LAAAFHGATVGWFVPTYKNGRPLWRWAEQTAAPLRKARLADISRAEQHISFMRRGSLGIFSADNEDGARGWAFHLVILDEAARISETCWQEVIQPTLADYGGDAFLISSPKGRNWFWKEYMSADGTYQAAWRAPSSDNPIPQIRHAYERAKTRVPDRVFRQEWGAEFIEDEGLVFRYIKDAAMLCPLTGPLPGRQYVGGLDWGKRVDYTVLTLLDAATHEQVHMDRMSGIDYSLQLQRIKATCARFGVTRVVAELNAMGDPLIEEGLRMGIPLEPFTTTNATKAVIIEALALGFEQRALTILTDEVLTGELEAFESTRLPSGLYRYSAPDGLHDDCVISLALAWHAASEPGAALSDFDDVPASTYHSDRRRSNYV
jgi:hypothetical protein